MLSISYIANSEPSVSIPKVDQVELRIRRRQYADFQKALKRNAKIIKKVQELIPGWVPKMPTDLEIKKALRKQS